MHLSNTTERVKAFIRYYFSDYNWFEEMTDVKSSKWRDLDREKTKAVTVEMLEGLCRTWPEYAYWFVTGVAESKRGQKTPTDYLEFNYETVRFLEPGEVECWRDKTGVLCGTAGTLNIERHSIEYELSVVHRILEGSGATNWDDARALANAFWEEFLKDLAVGRKLSMTPKKIKEWVNQFPIGERSPRDPTPTR